MSESLSAGHGDAGAPYSVSSAVPDTRRGLLASVVAALPATSRAGSGADAAVACGPTTSTGETVPAADLAATAWSAVQSTPPRLLADLRVPKRSVSLETDVVSAQAPSFLSLLRHSVEALSANAHVVAIELDRGEGGWDLYVYLDRWDGRVVEAVSEAIGGVYNALAEAGVEMPMDAHIIDAEDAGPRTAASGGPYILYGSQEAPGD